MIIYLDLIFFINFAYDFLLILAVANILKRKGSFKRYLLASFIGALSIFLLFININETVLFFLKILVSFLMVIIAFKFINLKYTLNNIAYLYMCSIILAGFLYFLNCEFAYKKVGPIFVYEGLGINYLLLLIMAPFILYWHFYTHKKFKSTYSNYYKVEVAFDSIKIKCTGLLDSGNCLKDPTTGRSVIILHHKLLKGVYNIRSPIYVKYNCVNGQGLMKCFKPSYIKINNQKIYNYLIGESENRFADGIECLLNRKLMEDNYV